MGANGAVTVQAAARAAGRAGRAVVASVQQGHTDALVTAQVRRGRALGVPPTARAGGRGRRWPDGHATAGRAARAVPALGVTAAGETLAQDTHTGRTGTAAAAVRVWSDRRTAGLALRRQDS